MYKVIYRDGDSDKIETFTAKNISDLDGSISGVEMDGGNVISVQDLNTDRMVTPEEIGSCQVQAW